MARTLVEELRCDLASVLFRCSGKPVLLEGLLSPTPGCAWFREVVLALAHLPLHNLVQSGFEPFVLIEAHLRKVIHYFPLRCISPSPLSLHSAPCTVILESEKRKRPGLWPSSSLLRNEETKENPS